MSLICKAAYIGIVLPAHFPIKDTVITPKNDSGENKCMYVCMHVCMHVCITQSAQDQKDVFPRFCQRRLKHRANVLEIIICVFDYVGGVGINDMHPTHTVSLGDIQNSLSSSIWV